MAYLKRTANCGQLRASDAGKTVTLNGWVHRKRDHGGISFINLRDRHGVTQVVVDSDAGAALRAAADELKSEYCIAVRGTVRARPDSMVNPNMDTGAIELKIEELQILSRCETLPFVIDEKVDAKEDLRLKHRYLDMRSASMQRKLKLRHEAALAVRNFMASKGFYEIETPTLIKTTPEGARDFLVPSRVNPGKFYALPQSPQLFKQILMVGGFDRYFQLARCYRDEDARGDRQLEFTQIDLEMSFVERDDVLSLVEEMVVDLFRKTMGIELETPFTRIAYDDAIELYGSDKPDLRFGMAMQDFAPLAAKGSFQAFHDAVAAGGAVKALVVPGKADYSRKQIEELEAQAKVYGAKGMAFMKAGPNGALEGGVSKFFVGQEKAVLDRLGAKEGDLVLLVADAKKSVACASLGSVRSKLGAELGLCDPKTFKFAWVIDFPMFEWNEDEKKWDPAHHMFTMPQVRFHQTMEKDPGPVKGDLYDLVMNGYEMASGSIRIHDPELQKRVFNIVGFSEEEAMDKFGFLVEAFKYGPPPHGGAALGFDRLVMLMSGESTIREVIPFPKNTFGISPLDDCPSEAEAKQLEDLHIRIVEKADPK